MLLKSNLVKTGGQVEKNRELVRINWKIIKRISISLYYNNDMKKTTISLKCNLSYDKCILYLNWMKMLDLIEKKIDEDGFEQVILSNRGKVLYEKNLKKTGIIDNN